MNAFSFRIDPDFVSYMDRDTVRRQAALDRATFERIRSNFKKLDSHSFGRAQQLLNPFA